MRALLILFNSFLIIISSCASTNIKKEIPQCIQEKIDEFKKQEVANPPISIYKYRYQDKDVYYISAPCCDRYTILYDENCNIICYPSGGITGKGDGKCSNFFTKRTEEKLIWKDARKP